MRWNRSSSPLRATLRSWWCRSPLVISTTRYCAATFSTASRTSGNSSTGCSSMALPRATMRWISRAEIAPSVGQQTGARLRVIEVDISADDALEFCAGVLVVTLAVPERVVAVEADQFDHLRCALQKLDTEPSMARLPIGIHASPEKRARDALLRIASALAFRPRIPERHRAVEHRPFARMVVAVGDEVTKAFELEMPFGLCVAQRRFEMPAHHPPRAGIQVVAVGPATVVVVGVRHPEQPVVQPHLGFDRVSGADPVDGALDLAVGAGHAVTRCRIERAAQFDDIAGTVLDHFLAFHDADATQPHFAAGHQPLETLRRHFRKVLALDQQFARERHRARTE